MEHILKGLVASSLVGGQGGNIDPKHIKDMYYEDAVWSPIIDPDLGRFTDTMLAEAYAEYEKGGSLKAVINGVDYTDFTYANNSKGFSISVNGTDFVYTANMMNSTNSHNAESWEWYTEKAVIHPVPLKYLPAPFIYDSTSPEAFSKDYGTELFEALKSGRPCYYYSTEWNPNYALILGYDEPNIFSSGGNTICSFTFHFWMGDSSSPALGYLTSGMAWMHAPEA